MLAISSSRSPCRPAASAWPSLPMSAPAGISAGSTHSADSPATVTCGAGSGRSPACQCTLASRGLARYPPSIPAADERGDHPVDPVAFPGGGGGVDDLLRVAGRDVLAGDRVDDRGGEPLAQPPLGVGVLAGPPLVHRQPVRVQVMRDQVRAGQFHVRRACRQPLGDLLQLGGQLLPRFPPRTCRRCPSSYQTARQRPRPLAGRVHRDPVPQLDHLAAAPGGCAARRRSARARRVPGGRPSPAARGGRPCGPVVGILWGS